MPVYRANDYTSLETWTHLIPDYRVRLNKFYYGPKCNFYKNMKLDYVFLEVNHGWMKLSFKLENNNISLNARIRYNNDVFTKLMSVKEFERLLQ